MQDRMAARFRERAVEARKLAREMTDQAVRTMLLRVAADYETMAKLLETALSDS